MSPVLEVRHLAKAYGGVRAVEDVSFSVHAGEVVALIGPNGAGKSSVFNMLMGQIAPDAGSITIAGADVTGWPTRAIWRLGVGRTFQITQTFQSMTVAQNIETALLSHHGRANDLWRNGVDRYRVQALALLTRLGMQSFTEQPAASLAYGDLKRLDLALALANDPRLLLMDEPTAGMATAEGAAMMGLAAAQARVSDAAVLFTAHDMDAVFAHASRILVMDRGRLIAQGAPAQIRANPLVQDIYLGAGTMFGDADGR